MARQTRAQRRARRQKRAEGSAAAPAQQQERSRAVPQQARPRADGAVPEAAAPRRETRGGRFISESWAELKKVEWPGQSQVIQATTVVLLACTIVGLYLWGADLVLKRLVEKVFLGQ